MVISYILCPVCSLQCSCKYTRRTVVGRAIHFDRGGGTTTRSSVGSARSTACASRRDGGDKDGVIEALRINPRLYSVPSDLNACLNPSFRSESDRSRGWLPRVYNKYGARDKNLTRNWIGNYFRRAWKDGPTCKQSNAISFGITFWSQVTERLVQSSQRSFRKRFFSTRASA